MSRVATRSRARDERHPRLTLQYRDGLRWRTVKTYPIEEDLRVLTHLCGLLRKRKWETHWRVLLMPINFLIVTTELE